MNTKEHFIPDFLLECILMAEENVGNGFGGPFAALVVKDHTIIGRGVNKVLEHQDPTAHAEIVAIREACKNIGSYQLEGCYLYTSCEPCPMCLGAIYWARPEAIFYAASRKEAAESGFDDEHIYDEITRLPEERKIPALRYFPKEGLQPFEKWKENPLKNLY
jgi:guanine deaminase